MSGSHQNFSKASKTSLRIEPLNETYPANENDGAAVEAFVAGVLLAPPKRDGAEPADAAVALEVAAAEDAGANEKAGVDDAVVAGVLAAPNKPPVAAGVLEAAEAPKLRARIAT